MVLFSLLSGAIVAVAPGAWGVSELALLHRLAAELAAGDILIGDRGFGTYPVIAWLKHLQGVDFIGRTTRRTDGRRRLKRLGRNDWLVCWRKTPSCLSPWLDSFQRKARAVKRKKNKYPRLQAPRHQIQDRPKRNVRLSLAKQRRKQPALM